MKKVFSIILIVFWLMPSNAHAEASCGQWFGFGADVFGALGRAVSTAVKYLLHDDTKLTAKLVYDGEGGSKKGGGCGGAYTGANGSSNLTLALNAVASSITDIPAELTAYPDDIKIQETSIGQLADLRTKEIMKNRSSLDELSADKWAVEYRAQQRAIQAMTDALIMKKAYKELAAIAENISSGSYSDYSAAASTVATRRLTLDALMALRKRVIAARVRARAETMEANIDTSKIPTQAVLDESALTSAPNSNANTPAQNKVDNSNENTSGKIEDYGLNGDKVNEEGGE